MSSDLQPGLWHGLAAVAAIIIAVTMGCGPSRGEVTYALAQVVSTVEAGQATQRAEVTKLLDDAYARRLEADERVAQDLLAILKTQGALVAEILEEHTAATDDYVEETAGALSTDIGRTIDGICDVDFFGMTFAFAFLLLLDHLAGTGVPLEEIRKAIDDGLSMERYLNISSVCTVGPNGEWMLAYSP